jgi:broad specificity phosphatase PhoE
MGQLIVVRHGQESLLRTNFDDLSEQGREQATALGECFAAHGWELDLVYSGPAVRHRDTARRVGRAMEAAGRAWPVPMELTGLDEIDELSLVRATVGTLGEDEEIVRMRREMLEVRDREERSRRFRRLFEAVMVRWLRGEFEPEFFETWPQFRARVLSCVETMTSLSEPEPRILAFTSVGPLAVMLQRALGIDEVAAFGLAWRVRNTAVTIFCFDGRGRLSLEAFNTLPHLRDQKQWTLR